MKKVVFTLFALTMVVSSYCQQDTINIKNDSIGYKHELQNFFLFLSKNYSYYDVIDFDKKENLSLLENECTKILEVIQAKTKNIQQQIMLPMYVSESIFIFYPFEVGGKNYPAIYTDFINLKEIVQKMLKAKNEHKFKKMNSKLITDIDKILNKKEN